MKKSKIPSIARKNRIISNIREAMISRDRFLLLGHQNPDEDCIASMIAFSLILSKFTKDVFLMIRDKRNENFQYLLNICKYNYIEILDKRRKVPENISTIVFFDTPKPDMIDCFPNYRGLLEDDSILKMEIDHHLEADSSYIGDPDYCLVDEASSSCELVGLLGCKLNNRTDLLNTYQIGDLFSRNLVLAILTGIIGDSKMGRYLKTNREKWFYRLFSSLFDDLLSRKTLKSSSNFSTMQEVFAELERLSEKEDACFNYMMKKRVRNSPFIGSVLLDEKDTEYLNTLYEEDTLVTVARYAADKLAEESGHVSLVVYYDPPEVSDLIQFRMRRSQDFKKLDLRDILTTFGIENGGGHPGAIGFRLPRGKIDDIREFVRELTEKTEALIAEN